MTESTQVGVTHHLQGKSRNTARVRENDKKQIGINSGWCKHST